MLRVDRDVTDPEGNVVLSETRYFVTSKDPGRVCAEDLLGHVRHHWQIENCIFHIKDCWWHEDRHWTKRPQLSLWLATLTTIAIVVLRLLDTREPTLPIRARADHIQWAAIRGLKLLGLA